SDYASIQIKTRIENGTHYEQILKLANEWGADLIVMGTHGRTGIAHAVMGSVAEKIVRHASCPVLTIKSTSG
ncbi:MAG: universal stress protein, partial [Planctomycetota bacterium]